MKKIKNIAIIAHVDHGKTTLVDELIKKSNTLTSNEKIDVRALDSNDLEKERGITILAKTTSIKYKDYIINILDTPGHSDFGGEVERIMNMVDGVLLIVDAYEGPMPQTRFVLKKALEANIKPLVIINKVDKPSARISYVLDEVINLFIELGASDEQLDFAVAYASAINGTISLNEDISTQNSNYDCLFELIVNNIPNPKGDENKPLQLQISLLDYNDFVGRIGIGVIKNGKIKTNEMVSCARNDGSIKQFRVQKLFGFYGLNKIEINSASAGDIIAVAGLSDIFVGETICNPTNILPMEKITIEEPTLQMKFSVNSSPFAGQSGKFLTARKIAERLFKETQRDVSLRVEEIDNDSFLVMGRGELHLSILIENMRREGYEFEVSKSETIIKEIDGVKCEPYEDLQIDIPEEYMGNVIEALGQRGGKIKNMFQEDKQVRLNYTIASRGLIGFMTSFMTLTKGYGIINHTFKEYNKIDSNISNERKLGVLVSMENGKATVYSIGQLEDRGILFIEPGTQVYEGMIIGECNLDNDLAVNVIKGKQLTNTRASSSDHTVVLKRPRKLSLEYCLDYINNDELVEVTPDAIRLRKKILNANERKKQKNAN
ncbi:MAG: translational GTPase TypA [bacterium]|nr:translational GTPase TypA [bacterium]